MFELALNQAGLPQKGGAITVAGKTAAGDS